MNIRGVLFDKDGTLIDVTGTWVPVYREMLTELATPDPAQVEALMVRAGYDSETGSFRAGSTLAGGTTRELIELWWPNLDRDQVEEMVRIMDVDYRDLALKHLKPLMPIEPILGELRAIGLKLGVATNDTVLSARNHMEALGVLDRFDVIIGADSVERPKPAGDMVEAFARSAGLRPSEIAMVGDNPHDMETARAGGAGLAIAVLSGNAGPQDIAHLADYTVENIAALPSLLSRLP
jgi:phosphoglycolate phosphatase